uniref:SFRICE_030868 n=1 Tax=Spodoptera frugiperda TaxID=7108 RepID=A0A2H1WY40_SPOFR
MKHQQVSVDYWAMLKSMLMYGVLTALGWLMLRLFNAVFSLPRRLRTQQENIQATLEEFQRRYPDQNVTEDDIKNAEKELEEWNKEMDEKLKNKEQAGKTKCEIDGVCEKCDEPVGNTKEGSEEKKTK